MFGIGPLELLVIVVAVLVFVGPQRLPEVMRHFGKFFVHARRYSNDIRDGFNQVIQDAEREVRLEEVKALEKDLKDVTPTEDKTDPAEEPVNEPVETEIPHERSTGFADLEDNSSHDSKDQAHQREKN